MEFLGVEASLLPMIAIGFGVGIISGLLGVGGGVLMTPLLFLSGLSLPLAVGTTLAQMIASSISGTFKHWRVGNVSWPIVLCFAVPGLLGVIAGKSLLVHFAKIEGSRDSLSLGYGVFLLIMSFLILRRELSKQKVRQPQRLSAKKSLPGPRLYLKSIGRELPVIPFAVFGFSIGVLSGMTGLGGGFFYMPIMVYLFGLSASLAVGSSLAIVVATSISGAVSFYTQNLVDVKLAVYLALGSVLGAYLGASLSHIIAGPRLKLYFAALVLTAGLATILRFLGLQSGALYLLIGSAFLVIVLSFWDGLKARKDS